MAKQNQLSLIFDNSSASTIMSEQMASGSMRITKQLCDDSSVNIGKICSSCFEITIYDDENVSLLGKSFRPILSYTIDGEHYSTTSLGHYTVESEKRSNDGVWKTLTCYDDVYYWAKIDVTDYLKEITTQAYSDVNNYMTNCVATLEKDAIDNHSNVPTSGSESFGEWSLSPSYNYYDASFYVYAQSVQEELESVYPTLNEVINSLITSCDIKTKFVLNTTCDYVNFYGIDFKEGQSISFLDFLQYYCQLCGTFGRFNSVNQFLLTDMSPNNITIDNSKIVQNGLNYDNTTSIAPSRVIVSQTYDKEYALDDEGGFIFKSDIESYSERRSYTDWQPLRIRIAKYLMLLPTGVRIFGDISRITWMLRSGYSDCESFENHNNGDVYEGSFGSGNNACEVSGNVLLQRQDKNVLNSVAEKIYSSLATFSNFESATVKTNQGINPNVMSYILGDKLKITGNFETIEMPILKMVITGIETLSFEFSASGSSDYSNNIISGFSNMQSANVRASEIVIDDEGSVSSESKRLVSGGKVYEALENSLSEYAKSSALDSYVKTSTLESDYMDADFIYDNYINKTMYNEHFEVCNRGFIDDKTTLKLSGNQVVLFLNGTNARSMVGEYIPVDFRSDTEIHFSCVLVSATSGRKYNAYTAIRESGYVDGEFYDNDGIGYNFSLGANDWKVYGNATWLVDRVKKN